MWVNLGNHKLPRFYKLFVRNLIELNNGQWTITKKNPRNKPKW